MQRLPTIYILVFLCSLWGCKPQTIEIQLNEIPMGHFANIYGAPVVDSSFNRTPLTIAGKRFDQGLGLHAPARININVQQQALVFHAVIGVDQSAEAWFTDSTRHQFRPYDYVYDNQVDHNDNTKGASVVFKVLGDGQELFTSDTFNVNTAAQQIELDIQNINTLTLCVEDANDGSYIDFANWADAGLSMKNIPDNMSLSYHNKAVIINHQGYHPAAAKRCYYHGEVQEFQLIDKASQQAVYTGRLQTGGQDLGNYLIGDFSNFKTEGDYYIQIGDQKSNTFRIDHKLLKKNLLSHIEYLGKQRSAHPMGWNGAQHLDDGIRHDNGKYQEAWGGWYDACDVRKFPFGNALVINALCQCHSLLSDSSHANRLIDEIKWGTDFILRMQEPEGLVFLAMGTTSHGLNDNRWTDNKLHSGDERAILTRPCGFSLHINIAKALERVSLLTASSDPAYSQTCHDAALRCFQWTMTHQADSLTTDQMARASLCCNVFYSSTQEEKYKAMAVEFVSTILKNQQRQDEQSGIYYIDAPDNIFINQSVCNWALGAFINFAESYPNHPLTADIQKAIIKSLDDYYLKLCPRNAFLLIPWIVNPQPIGGSRRAGGLHYRYFKDWVNWPPNNNTGVNYHAGLEAYFLMRAARLLKRDDVQAIAQAQLDWLSGANPLNASSISGIGYNQPTLHEAGDSHFPSPHTPVMAGGVMVGTGGDYQDNPMTGPGWWITAEYWELPLMSALLLEDELNLYYNDQQ